MNFMKKKLFFISLCIVFPWNIQTKASPFRHPFYEEIFKNLGDEGKQCEITEIVYNHLLEANLSFRDVILLDSILYLGANYLMTMNELVASNDSKIESCKRNLVNLIPDDLDFGIIKFFDVINEKLCLDRLLLKILNRISVSFPEQKELFEEFVFALCEHLNNSYRILMYKLCTHGLIEHLVLFKKIYLANEQELLRESSKAINNLIVQFDEDINDIKFQFMESIAETVFIFGGINLRIHEIVELPKFRSFIMKFLDQSFFLKWIIKMHDKRK